MKYIMYFLLFVVAMILIGIKNINYNLIYERSVKETIIEMVKPEALKEKR